MTKPKVLLDGLVFAEGPRWHDGRLWLSDMHGHKVLAITPEGRAETIAEMPARPSGLGFLPDGTPIAVSMADRRLVKLTREGVEPYSDLSSLVSGDPNDMVVDAKGRAYVGNFGFDLLGGAEMKTAELVLVEPGGAARVVADELQFPNGMVITPDGSKLIVAETFGGRLAAFDIRMDGSLVRRANFAELGERTPDGIALDAEGCVWASCFNDDEFIRVAEGGEIRDTIALDGRRAVACALGGPNRRTLYLLTAETTVEELAKGQSKARVETVEVAVGGAGWP
jgi:sugar lactone lactonase YvrE